MRWTAHDIPDQRGRTALITGANSGLGLETARELARKGAKVLMGCRSAERAQAAMVDIRSVVPEARLEHLPLDLADLRSVRAAAAHLAEAHPVIHLLINNAGIMAIPRRTTADGLEMQLGTNHLGHFALTGLVLPRMHAASDARVVTVSSIGHRTGRMRFDDLMGERSYQRWLQYGRSKLANLLFQHDLSRRLQAVGSPIRSLAAHPGASQSNLVNVAPAMEGSAFGRVFAWVSTNLVSMPAAQGALPQLRAATDPLARDGEYYGPDGVRELWGWPTLASRSALSRDAETAARLWDVSVQLTGVHYADLA